MDSSYGSEAESGTGLPTKHAKCRCDVLLHVGGVCRSAVGDTASQQCNTPATATASTNSCLPQQRRLPGPNRSRGLPGEVLANIYIHPYFREYTLRVGLKLGYRRCCAESFAKGRTGIHRSSYVVELLHEMFGKDLQMIPCANCEQELIAGRLGPDDMRSGRTEQIQGEALKQLQLDVREEMRAEGWAIPENSRKILPKIYRKIG